jgi:hypothetical protein
LTKRKISILVAIGVLALGLTAGVVMAQDSGNGNSSSEGQTFAARVAQILGLEEATVDSAFTQASRQAEDEAYRARLDRMVEAERLTQEDADARFTWFQGRPDSTVSEYGKSHHSFRGGEFREHRGGRSGHDGFRHGRREHGHMESGSGDDDPEQG